MAFCIFLLISAVGISPVAYLCISKKSIDFYPAFLGKSGYVAPGFIFLATSLAADLPKTTKSNKELAPNLLAP